MSVGKNVISEPRWGIASVNGTSYTQSSAYAFVESAYAHVTSAPSYAFTWSTESTTGNSARSFS